MTKKERQNEIKMYIENAIGNMRHTVSFAPELQKKHNRSNKHMMDWCLKSITEQFGKGCGVLGYSMFYTKDIDEETYDIYYQMLFEVKIELEDIIIKRYLCE